MTKRPGLLIHKKILLTEDAELLAVIRETFFGRRDFQLTTAEDAAEAYYLVEEEDPILVILAQEIPGGGDACCRRIKADPFLRPTPVILIAADERAETVQRCREAGCDEVLLRPLTDHQLLAAACRLLGLPERLDHRLPVQLPARFGDEGEVLRGARIADLSLGGLFLETSHLVPVGRLLALELVLPGRGEPLRLRGRVTWVNHPEWMKSELLPVGMGLRFENLGAEEESELRHYLRKSTGDHPAPFASGLGGPQRQA